MPGIATPGAGVGGSHQNMINMGSQHARTGRADVGAELGAQLNALDLAERAHYPEAANNYADLGTGTGASDTYSSTILPGLPASGKPADAPNWYNYGTAPPVPYDAASAQKEHIRLKQDVYEAARKRAQKDAGPGGPAVVHSGGDLNEEIAYVKHMKDQAELAKFDDYVSSMIDPREPGNLQWLMEVYPSFVTRRLQQAHSEYEFALRKQMIDQWGVNTFDDLHFLYMCDQGQFGNMPILQRRQTATPGDAYAAGFFSPYNHFKKNGNSNKMGLPFSSADYGHKPEGGPAAWTLDRAKLNRTASSGVSQREMSQAVFGTGGAPPTTTYAPGGDYRRDPAYGQATYNPN